MDEESEIFETAVPVAALQRLSRFLRSVIPCDPWQLLFLTGTIFLLISPRLSWLQETLLFSYPSMQREAVDFYGFYTFLVACNTVILLAALVALFACFLPVRAPARRILWFVLMPSVISFILILWRFFQVTGRSGSILEPRSKFLQVILWLRLDIWRFPAGAYFIFSTLGSGGDSGLSVLAINHNGEARPDPVGGTGTRFARLKLLVCAVSRSIIRVAGEPGDRWAGLRKKAGREESPDTPLREQRKSLGCKA